MWMTAVAGGAGWGPPGTGFLFPGGGGAGFRGPRFRVFARPGMRASGFRVLLAASPQATLERLELLSLEAHEPGALHRRAVRTEIARAVLEDPALVRGDRAPELALQPRRAVHRLRGPALRRGGAAEGAGRGECDNGADADERGGGDGGEGDPCGFHDVNVALTGSRGIPRSRDGPLR
jgi:hypothetical protein